MKKYLLALLMVVGIGLLAACNSGSEEEASGNEAEAEKEDGEKIELRMSWWGSQLRHDMTNEIIAMFEEEYPNIEIVSEFTGWDGYFQKMAAQAAGKNLPDIMQQNFGDEINQYAKQDALADLAPFIEDGTIELDGVSEGVLASGQVNGTQYGIPTGMNAISNIYNAKTFEEAGVEKPTHDWTWDEYVDIVKKVHEETGKYGARLLEPENTFEYFLRERGLKLFDGASLGYDDDQVLVDYFTMVKELVDAGAMPGYDVIQQVKGMEDEILVRGDAPMTQHWSNQFGTFVENTEDPLEMVMLPGENNEQGMYLKPAMLWSVSENSEHKEEAALFINYFTNTVEVFEVIGSDRGVPINPEVREQLVDGLSDTEKKVYDYIDYVTDHSSPVDTDLPEGATEVINELINIDELVVYGEITPEEGAKRFRENAENLLAE